jgi:ribosome biogenesis GTPase / thiamine phosphate phosphatase
MSNNKGLVVRGSRNLFTVRAGGKEIECRIKGKVLKGVEGYYNALAPGDIVEINNGLITGFEKRRNCFARFNQKGQAPQLLASNVDLIVCVSSIASPPFRPRFIDRALAQAEIAGIKAAIVCNKYDLADPDPADHDPADHDLGDSDLADPDIEERLSDFERIGYPVFRLSAKSGMGLDEFRQFISGKFSVLVGQSGTGKSSLINALIPALEIKTGEINEKYSRGKHTTTQGVLLESMDGGGESNSIRIIDTPGIRRFAIAGLKASELIFYMREFAPLAGKCSYGLSCSHQTEIGCKIMEAVYAGVIHEDRYESFLRIQDEIAGKNSYVDGD